MTPPEPREAPSEPLRDTERDAERMRLERRVAQLSILAEIAVFLHSSTDLDRVLRVILTGVTSGKGFGFNRAFLLLVNEGKGLLEGRMGVGPADPAEAQRVWAQLEHLSLRDVLFQAAFSIPRDPRIETLVEGLSVSLEERDHFLVHALERRDAAQCDRDDPRCREAAEALGTPAFAIAPIHTRSRTIGVLLADNAITGAPIQADDLEILASFANEAGIAIEKAYLYDELRRKVDELEETRGDLIRHQQLLLESERLRTLGEMSARVAHEIRNPLVAIGGFAGRLLRRKPAEDPDLCDLRIIVEETERLERILEELLDYARPRYNLKLGPCDVAGLLESAVGVLWEPLADQGIELKLGVDEDLPEVSGDPNRLRQLLLDLVRNAQEAMPEGGTLTVRAERLAGNGVALEVLDTGPGVVPGEEERVFEAFYTKKPGGSGLGLAVARCIAEEHGARLECRSGPGGCFTLRLPVWRETEGSGEDAKP